MATAHCANRPSQSSQTRPDRGAPNNRPNTTAGVPNQQDPPHVCPEMYTTSQDPQPEPLCASHPHNHMPPHPFMYIPPATHHQPQPPPMPPFLQCQWPMQYSYNPFSGFPPIGYGMVMPPFPPNPYLGTPGYMLTQPHPQQFNCRRLIHKQYSAATAPYQSQNRNGIFREQNNASAVKVTVSSEVQTEPTRSVTGYANGSPLHGSESGIVTNSTFSDSSREQQRCTVVQSYTMAASDTEDNLLVSKMGSSDGPMKHGSENLSAKTDSIEYQTKSAQNGKKGVPCKRVRDDHANMWSMCSPDGIVPVCSSSDRDDDFCPKLRRVSLSDTLISCVGGVQPVLPDHPLPKTRETLSSVGLGDRTISLHPVAPSSHKQIADNDEGAVVFSPTASAALNKILGLPFSLCGSPSNTLHDPAVLVDSIMAHLHSRNGLLQNTTRLDYTNQSQEVPDEKLLPDYEESSLHDEATNILQERFSSNFQGKRKMYESIWSGDSLPPYDRNDWVMQTDLMFGDLLEKAKMCVPEEEDEKKCHKFSMSAESPPSQSRFPNYFVEKPHLNLSHTFCQTTQNDGHASAPTETFNPQKCQTGVQTPLSKGHQLRRDDGRDSSNALVEVNIRETLDVGEGADPDVSSEAVPSPNQEPCEVTKRRGISPCSSKQVEAPLSNSLTEKKNPPSNPKSLQIKESANELRGKVAMSLTTDERLAVEIQNRAAVTTSKVDCGTQCTELQDCCHLCKGRNVGGYMRGTLACSGRANRVNTWEEVCEKPQSPRNTSSGRTVSKTEVRQQRSNKPYSRRYRYKDGWEDTWNGYNGRPGKSKVAEVVLEETQDTDNI